MRDEYQILPSRGKRIRFHMTEVRYSEVKCILIRQDGPLALQLNVVE